MIIKSKPVNILRQYWTPSLLTILFLGFLSGLPLALTGATLTAWLAQSNVDIKTIGLFAAVGIPYSLKFLWAPAMDALPFPLFSRQFGRRRGWIIATQLALATALVTLAFSGPDINPLVTAVSALLVAFLSASQDIVIDAYRVEILHPEEQGKGAAMIQLGYRLGMIVSSAGALHLVKHVGWQGTYLVMSCIILAGIITALLAKEPGQENTLQIKTIRFPNLRESTIEPFISFTRNESWWLILVFVVVYKLADAFIGIVTNPFLIDLGFSLEQIANIVKIYGTIATLFGTFCGGYLVMRYGTIRIMFVAGFLHAVTNLLYVLQAYVGADANVLALSVAVENITGGISSAAFVAFLSGLCNRHYTATQYALLSSLASLGRTLVATRAGYAVKYLGWEWFFALATLLALPGLLVLWCLKNRLGKTSHDSSDLDTRRQENL